MWSTSCPLIVSDNSSHRLGTKFGAKLSNSDFLRRYARRLLRNAQAEQTATALPILRRIIAAKVTPEIQLTDLYAVRASLQLKHILHMLARELDFTSWASCKNQIDERDAATLDRYRFELGMFGDYRHNWFADIVTARDWQKQHGGYLIEYGQQAVAILA